MGELGENNKHQLADMHSASKPKIARKKTLLDMLAKTVLLGSFAVNSVLNFIKQTSPAQEEKPQFPNGMGPRFNALTRLQQCAVIFEILFYRADQGISREALSQRLLAFGEHWAQPEHVSHATSVFKAAYKDPEDALHPRAKAARDIFRGIEPKSPRRKQDNPAEPSR